MTLEQLQMLTAPTSEKGKLEEAMLNPIDHLLNVLGGEDQTAQKNNNTKKRVPLPKSIKDIDG